MLGCSRTGGGGGGRGEGRGILGNHIVMHTIFASFVTFFVVGVINSPPNLCH